MPEASIQQLEYLGNEICDERINPFPFPNCRREKFRYISIPSGCANYLTPSGSADYLTPTGSADSPKMK